MKKTYELGMTGDEITYYAKELRLLEEQENKTYKKLINEIEEKKTQYHKLEESLNNIRQQLIENKENLEDQLMETNVTKEKLDEFKGKKETLNSYGINIDDIDKLETLITNFKQHDYNMKEIMNFYEEMVILRENIDDRRKENIKIENKNDELKRENDRLESLLQKNMSMLSSIKSLEKTEINPEDLLDVVKTVISMSQGLNLSNREAFERFVDDIKTQYTERNNYQFQIEELKELYRMYQNKNSILKDELEVLEEVVLDRKNTIDAIRKFEVLAVSEVEIIEWGKLVKELGYEISSFRRMLIEIGGLPNYIELKTKEIRELEEIEKTLNEEINEHEVQLKSLKETLLLLHTNIGEEANKIKETIDDFDNYFTSPSSGFKAMSKEILSEVTENMSNLLTNTKNEWSEDLSSLENNVEKILDETERILQNSYKGGRIVGQFHSLEPISKILREEEVSNIEGTISIITMLTYIQKWLKRNKSDEYKVFDDVIKILMEDLGDIY